jgi:ElaB/YqjD/DUF883 family membrane-anchored ribosome-binding protein
MELYYKNLISEDTSLERLVEDLMRVVQGADDFIQVAGADLEPARKAEISNRLARLKDACQRLKERAVAGAVATDKLLRRYPYSSVGIAFAIGIMSGIAMTHRRE